MSKHKNSPDPKWVLAQGRLALVLGEPQSAIKFLGRLHDSSPKSVSVLIDLASAYFEKAEKDDSDIYYGKSLELLSEALDQEPENAVALYNCAIAEERQFLYRQATEHWTSYLALDKSGGWSKEAADHLTLDRQKLEQHQARINAPLLSPSQVAAGLRARDPGVLAEIAQRVEEYADIAVQDWLVQAYSSSPQPDAVSALHGLGRILLEEHGDPWSLDFLRSTPNSGSSQKAVQWLRQSIRANIQGDAVDALHFADQAYAMFSLAGSQPGVLRAQVEKVNALRLMFKSRECIAAGQKIEKALTMQRYYQLLARMELEQTSCLVRAGKQDAGLESLKRAATAVSDGRLGSQEINVLNYQSALDALKDGRSAPLWKMSRDALNIFWNGVFPDKRAYPFYTKLADWAEENGEPFLFLEFAREAAATIDATDLTSFRAMAHYRFAEASVAARRMQAAGNEFNRAESLFQELPQNESVLVHRAAIEVSLAELEAQRGDQERAFARLAKLEQRLSSIESFLVEFQFYSTRAFLFARQGKNSEAETDYRRAIAAAERSLASVKDERERLAWSRSYGAAYRGLAQVLINQSRTEEALRVWESFRASDLRSFAKQPDEAGEDEIGLNSLQQSLGSNVALVYMLTENGLAIWTVSAQRIGFHEVRVDRGALAQSAAQLVSLCSDPETDSAEIQREARRLYQTLIAPVESDMGSGAVIVEPDEELAAVPFEVLVGANGRYLVENRSVTYLPGLLFANRLRRARQTDDKALVVGVSAVPAAYRQVLQPLPDAEQEAREVGRQLPHARVLTGETARLQIVLPWLSQSTIFHFAGHSIYENGRLELVLDQGRGDGRPFLDVTRLSRSKFGSFRLIVLSACSTQGASGQSFHQAQNAVRLMLQARVPDTVASRWDIDSRTTMEFMKEFYHQLSLQKDTSRSLAQAMNNARLEHPHPYYWAAFSSFGN